MRTNAGTWIGIVCGIIGLVVSAAIVLLFNGPGSIFISGGMALLFGVVGLIFYKFIFGPMITTARLEKTGMPGKAIITHIRETNVYINNRPQIKVMLQLKNMLGQTYTAEVRKTVSRWEPVTYQIGATVAVLIDPNDELKMILDSNGNG